jgi:transcriptional regulator with AAA-type ATPase domain
MTSPVIQRQELIQSINTLPDEVLTELASFLEYLQYKTLHQKTTPPQQNFLLSIAALGESGQDNISESDEAILRNEIDSILCSKYQ